MRGALYYLAFFYGSKSLNPVDTNNLLELLRSVREVGSQVLAGRVTSRFIWGCGLLVVYF